MLEKVFQIHKTYLLHQQLFCWRHFSQTEVVQNTDLNTLAEFGVLKFVILKFSYLYILEVCKWNFENKLK